MYTQTHTLTQTHTQTHSKKGKMATLVLGLVPRQFVDLEILCIYSL